MSSIASNHCLSSLCFRRLQHTDNLPLIIGIGVGIPVCLLLLVVIYCLYADILLHHTDNLPLIIGNIGVGIPVCLLLLVISVYLLYVTGGFIIQTIYH